jgi:hypothetical protein
VQPQLDGTTDPVAPVAARGLAAVRPGRGGGGSIDALVIYDGKRWQSVYRAPSMSEPTWMPDGSSVWTIAGEPDGTQRITAVELSSTVSTDRVTVRQVAIDLAGSGLRTVGRLSRLRLSRDGTRVAFVRVPVGGTASDGRPYVARVDAVDGGLSISGLRALAPACPSSGPQRCLTAAIDVAWADAANLVVLGNTNASDPGTHAPYLVAVDGSAVQPVGTAGLASDVSSITAAPGAPMLAVVPGAGRTDPTIYEQSGDSWVRVGNGYAVRYPD